jgi:hypothetical protein
MNKSKALKTAKEWLFPALMYSLYDCSDSKHNAEELESRFNAHVDDTISINDFVKKNLHKEFLVECVKALDEGGHDHSEWREYFESPVSALPFKFSEIEKDLESLFS